MNPSTPASNSIWVTSRYDLNSDVKFAQAISSENDPTPRKFLNHWPFGIPWLYHRQVPQYYHQLTNSTTTATEILSLHEVVRYCIRRSSIILLFVWKSWCFDIWLWCYCLPPLPLLNSLGPSWTFKLTKALFSIKDARCWSWVWRKIPTWNVANLLSCSSIV